MRLSTENIAYALDYIDELVTSFNTSDPALYPELIGEVIDHKKAYYRIAEQSEMTGPGVSAEGDNYFEVDSVMPFQQDFTTLKYTAKYVVSPEAMYTDHSNTFKGSIGSVVKNPTNLIAQRYRMQRDQSASNAYTLGFTVPASGGTPTLDGVAWFSASHPLSSGVQSNLLTTALSVAAVETAIQTIMALKTYQLSPWMYDGNFDLVVPPALTILAMRIAESVQQQGTNDNDKNVVGRYINVIPNPFLTDASDWFIKPRKKNKNPLKRISRLPFQSFGREGDGGAMITTFHEEWVDVATNHRGNVGSQV